MKRKLTFLLTALLLLTGLSSWGQSRTQINWVASEQGYDNGQVIESVEFDSHVLGSFNKGTNSNPPKYYNTGSAVRCYGGNYFTITVDEGSLTEIVLTFASGDGSNAITTDVGTYSNGTWTGSTSAVTFTIGGTSGHRRISQFDITYSGGGGQQTVATPTFSPEGGTYYESQQVSINCTTEEALIYYTLDGSTPDESSMPYTTPLTITETTTVKAKAFKSGYTASNVATATYNIPTLITIAEARALTTNEYALVQGVVTFIDNRNIYIQDATGGIDLFLNNGTVPSTVALGDMVQAYGKIALYNGLIELSGINGNNADEFSILSSGNTLPLAVKTISEVLAGAEATGTLQATRVKIEGAVIGAINTNGNTTLTQGDDVINIYKVPELPNISEGQTVDVTAVVGYFNAPQLRVALASDVELYVIANPQLNVSTTSLNGFQYIYGSGPSAEKNFLVSGSDLTNDVVLTAPQNYELSHSPNNGYFDSETLSPVNGTLDEITIYVRLKAGLQAGNYNGNLTITCDNLSKTIALTGTVSEQPVAAAPTFSPNGGSYITAQTVSMSCETQGASIYYTTDDSTPTESSTLYSQPITVSTTTTIKAIAVAEGYQNSTVATATYTISEVISIASARALANNEYACVEGTVTFMDGRNVYIQDASAGIDLYLNSNTVPTNLAIGDNVRAYGKKTTFNGLVELTGIAGNNAEVFTIISSGNTLPLATKTIAEINSDFGGNNLLQATRVKVENAVIGTINPSSTTVITQEGNNLNVYHIPTVEGLVQGDWVTITGIVGCYNAPQLLVASADDIQFTHRPSIVPTPASLSGLDYEYEQGGPSEIVYFTLSGQNLLSHVEVYPSENFEISTMGGNYFSPENPASIHSQGHFTGIKIFVRLKAGLEEGTYAEQLSLVSQDADTVYVSVTGTVIGSEPPTPPTPPTPSGEYVRINDLSQLTEGSLVVFAARFNSTATSYYAMSNQASGKPTGVLFTSTTSGSDEVLPATIVDEESSYYWTVGVTSNGYTFTNANEQLIGYTSSTNFATGGDNTEWGITIQTSESGAMVPNYTGFVVANVNNPIRAFALNSSHNFGPYHTQNMAGENYNFFLDLFVKGEGGVTPPTPTVATPTFAPAAGTYFEAQTVSIACSTEGATIHYTLDGTEPTENSAVYTAPFTIEATTTVKAIAMKEGYNNSNVAEATYTIQMGFVTIFNQDWEGEMNGWTFVDVEGEMSWTVASYQGNHYAYANGYNHGANEDWCISPAFNLNAYDNPVLSFRTAKNYTGNDLEVFFSNDYDGEDPTNATWQPLTCALSTGSWTWVESGDISLSNFSGSECYIGFKYTCEDGSAAGWEVDDIVLIGQTSEPVVTVTPLALTGFTYMEGNGPSAAQTFTVSGLNLSGNVTITAPTHYEISETSGSGYTQSPITLNPVGGNIEEAIIYIRLIAGLTTGEYNNEIITVASNDIDAIQVTCSGTVTEQPVPGDDYVRISDVSELADGNRVVIAARFDTNANDYYAMSNTASGKPTGVLFTSIISDGIEILPPSIFGDEDNFYWTVNVTDDGYTFTNAAGDMIGYTSSTNFSPNGDNTAWSIEMGTSEETAMVPNYTGFVISNVNNPVRAFALNSNHNFGPYHTQNIAGEGYNFFLDIFMQGEGGVPPTPTVAAPTFNPVGGTYYETQDVTISCTTAGATIHYSLDSENGPWEEYDGAITVDENMTIWAYAEKEGYNDSPVVSAEYVIEAGLNIIFWQEWENDWDPWHGWTERCTMGDSLWRVASYGGNHYAYANGYNHPQTIDWLISPAFDLDSYSEVVLTFNTAKNYNGPDLEVFFSNNYDGQDPDSATWIPLQCELSQGGWNWVASGDISLDEFSGSNCYIGFKYTSDEDAAGWEVDDIKLASGSTSPTPTLIATPNYLGDFSYVVGHGPSESQSYVLSGVNLNDEGYIHIVSCSWYEISLDNETFTEILEFPCTELPATVYVRMMEGLEPNTYDGVYIANIYGYENDDANVAVNVSGIVHYENEPTMSALMPLYIQGNNGSNNNRVPVAAPVHFNNLEPNTTYRYTNQFVDDNDGPETAGAGNVIYADPEGFYRSTSPSLSTEGGYGEFTTDDEGHALVWLMNEPTANARFTPGNHVYMRVRLNDGAYGVNVLYTFTSEDYATVLNFGTENDEYSGSAFYVKSNEASMSFAQIYAAEEELRPVYSTSIETIGVDYGSINQYADFYKEEVAGNDGWFGGIMPNVNDDGINFILVFDMDNNLVSGYYTEEGQWSPDANTVNPTNGLDEPIFIDLTDDGIDEPVATNVKVWSANKEFVIENGDDCRYTMSVVNMLGQTLMHQEVAAGSTMRVNHNLVPGVYIISLQNNQNKVAVKVMVR